MSSKSKSEAVDTRKLVEGAIEDDNFEFAVAIVEKAIRANKWLRLAYLSYYRRGTRMSLYEVGCLDWNNIEYFRLICNLRKLSGWTDQRLYELELLAQAMP